MTLVATACLQTAPAAVQKGLERGSQDTPESARDARRIRYEPHLPLARKAQSQMRAEGSTIEHGNGVCVNRGPVVGEQEGAQRLADLDNVL